MKISFACLSVHNLWCNAVSCCSVVLKPGTSSVGRGPSSSDLSRQLEALNTDDTDDFIPSTASGMPRKNSLSHKPYRSSSKLNARENRGAYSFSRDISIAYPTPLELMCILLPDSRGYMQDTTLLQVSAEGGDVLRLVYSIFLGCCNSK